MSGYEQSSLEAVEAVLDGLEEETAGQVYHATLPFDARAVAAVAASRADAASPGGSGGSVPEGWSVANVDRVEADAFNFDATSLSGFTFNLTSGPGGSTTFAVQEYNSGDAVFQARFTEEGVRQVGFYGATPVSQQTGVAVTVAAIHAALVNLGLITA